MDAAAIFTRFHEAWTDGDVDAVCALADPEIVVIPVHGLLYSQPEYSGRDGLARWYGEMTEPWESFEAIVEEIHPTPEGVVGFVHLVGHRGDELYDARVASFCEVRDGLITQLIARDIWDVKEELGV